MDYINSLFNEGRYEEIVKNFKMSDAEDLSVNHLILVGISFYNCADYQNAIKLFQLALKKEPNNIDALYNIIVLFYEVGDFSSAIIYSEKLLTINPSEWLPYIVSSLYEAQNGNLKKALDILEDGKVNCSREEIHQFEKIENNIRKVLFNFLPVLRTKFAKQKNVIHFGLDSSYIQDFIERILRNIPQVNHYVILFSEQKGFVKVGKVLENVTVNYLSELPIDFISNLILSSDKIILHGNFRLNVFQILSSLDALKKTYWVIWGGDIYTYYTKTTHTFDETLFEMMKIKYSSNFKAILGSHVDYTFSTTKYGKLGEYIRVYYPVLHDFDDVILSNFIQSNDSDKSRLRILLGNSATQTMEHFEVINFLSTLPKEKFDFVIYCPLSYGDMNYAQKVEQLGKRLLGDKFVPLKEFLPIYEYSKFLSTIDVGIFNVQRAQGMGNIIKLLRYGKRVVLRENSYGKKFLDDLGFSTNTIEEFFADPKKLFEPLPREIAEKNIKKAIENFSTENVTKYWTQIIIS